MKMMAFPQIKHTLRWNLFLTLGAIMLVCQTITVFWLWHESKEQITALVDLTLTKTEKADIIHQEEIESIVLLFFATFTMMTLTLFLSYNAIKRITTPLEELEKALRQRTADNLQPLQSHSQMREIKLITAALNSLFYRLDSTLQQERLFTADVAHELRTPLAGIRLHLELMEKTQHNDCQELIQRIDQLVNTIEQLLTLARASLKFTTQQLQLIDPIKDIQEKLAGELQELTEHKHQTLEWRIEPQARFQGEATLIRLLIRNLVENAYRYSPAQTSIIVRCYQKDDTVIWEVLDEGSGIDESQTEQLMQAFFRLDRRHQGIGLGLSIVSRITKLHRGHFTLANRLDRSGALAQFVVTSHC